MKKRKKRNPDLRRIRTRHVYTVQELAKSLERTPGTIHRWVERGLPILQGSKQVQIDGKELKLWLSKRRAARNRKCGDGELFCCKCDGPRNPMPGSVEFVSRTIKTVTMKAVCGECGTPMNQIGSLAKLSLYQAAFNSSAHQKPNLVGCNNPSVNEGTIIQDVDEFELENDGREFSLDTSASSSNLTHCGVLPARSNRPIRTREE